jgi:hypothetical protein
VFYELLLLLLLVVVVVVVVVVVAVVVVVVLVIVVDFISHKLPYFCILIVFVFFTCAYLYLAFSLSNFLLNKYEFNSIESFRSHYGSEIDSASNRNEFQES